MAIRAIKTAYVLPEHFDADARFKDKTIVYHHIGATGGRTFSRAIAKNFPKENSFSPQGNEFSGHYQDFIALPDAEKRKLTYICGHNAFGIHTALEQKCEYITIVRNPIQHFISAYYFRRYYDSRPGQAEPCDTLEKCVNTRLKQRRQPHGEGYLVDCLNGNMRPWADNAAPDNPHTMSKDEKTAFILEATELHFPFIGITELMDESMFVLARKLGWASVPFWYRRSSTKKYPFKIEEPSAPVLRKIIHLNEISISLYEIFTKKLLDEFDALKSRFPEIEDWIQEYRWQRIDNTRYANL